MASLSGSGDIVVVSGANSAFIFDKKLKSLQTLDPPKSDEDDSVPLGLRKGETSMEHADKHMACVALSECGQFLALASSRGKKSLFLWRLDGQTWNFVSQRLIGRAASKIRFTHSASAVLVADKAGDVYLFSVSEPEKGKEWLLGHIAMLLDVLVVDSEKFVLTCDRDDKIRVARFPNCYNIHSYCLGHTSFITSLALLPHNRKMLISTSGDGTVKIWNYLDGKEALSISIDKYVKPPCDGPMPIKQCSALKISADSSLLCVCIGGMSKCVVFHIEGSSEPVINLSRVIETDEEIWWPLFTEDKQLYLLKKSQSKPIGVWTWNESYELKECDSEISKTFNDHGDLLQECFTNPSIPAMLYRKKYDEPPEKTKKIK